MEVIMRIRHWSAVALLLLLIWTGAFVVHAIQSPAESVVPLPNKDGSFKFSVLGDFGVGDQKQFQLADQMAKLHGRFKYDLVVTVGDNILGSERPQDFQKKFEIPYKPLLDAGGKFYYSFSPKAKIRFFAFDSTYPEPEQIRWLEKELAASNDDWKIVFFHQP